MIVSCSSYKPPEPKPLPKIANTNKIVFNWKMDKLSRSIAGSFIPVMDDNAIFTADSEGNVYRIDSTDGSVISKFELKLRLSSGTAVSPDHIFVTTQTAKLVAVNRADGTIAWNTRLPTIAIEAPQVVNNIVIVKTNDGQLLAYDARTGSLLWIYQRQNPPLTLRSYNTFQIMGKEVVMFGEAGGKIALINLNNGTAIWENAIALSSGATDLDKLNDVSVRPVIINRIACVATYNGRIACFDAITSNVMWEKPFSTHYQIIMDEHNLYALNDTGEIFAFDENTGSLTWHNEVLKYRDLSGLGLLNGNPITIDEDGKIYMFNHLNGNLILIQDSNLSDGIALPLVLSNNDGLIIQSGNGDLAKLSQ